MTASRLGLYSAAVCYVERIPGAAGWLHASAMDAALRYLESTGEAMHSALDVLLLLHREAGDPCRAHCGDEPICLEHER